MAKITLSVETQLQQAQTGIKSLTADVQKLSQQLSATTTNKGLSTEIKRISDQYREYAQSASKAAEEGFRVQEASAKTVSAVETLRKGIANLITSLKTLATQYPDKLFADQAESAKTLLGNIEELSLTLKDKGKLDQNQVKQLQEISKWYKVVSADVAQLRAENDKIAGGDPFYPKATEQVTALKSRVASLLQTMQAQSRYYAKGTFDPYITDLKSAQVEINKLNQIAQQNNGLTEEQATRLAELRNQVNQTNAAFKEAASTNKNYHGTLRDLVTGFMKFQLSAMLVMKPLQMIRNAWQSINETLTETENKIIALRRVAGDAANANDLYDLAIKFGQTVENVNEAMLTFARRGMSWNESLKATEAALLAVNTADMTVAEATDGLSSVMSQFGIEASKLTEIVDKVNKANDKFPVTSEKILAALQRVGSTASAANLSLDKTLGLITTLSKATNRSGQNIGTALNAILNIAQKSSTLDTFAKLGADTAKVVDDYRHGIGSILDVLTAVAQKTKDIGDDLDKGSADLAGINDELRESLGEDFEILSDIYGTAGTYRRNYFIALLNDLDTVKSVQQEIADANGYSAKQNEDYLTSYTAKSQALQAQWQKFANDEQGLLGFKKLLVDIGSGLLSLTQATGGLRTTFIALGTVIGATFGTKIINALKSFVSGLYTANAAAGTLQLTLNGVLGIIGLLATAISAIVGLVKAANEAAEEARLQAIKTWEAMRDQANELENLTQKYKTLDSTNKEYAETEQRIIELLGTKAIALAGLTKGTEEYKKKVQELSEAQRLNNYYAAQAAYNSAKDIFNQPFTALQGRTTHISSDSRTPNGVYEADTEYQQLFTALANAGFDISSSVAYEGTGSYYGAYAQHKTLSKKTIGLTGNAYSDAETLLNALKFLSENGYKSDPIFNEWEKAYSDRYARIMDFATIAAEATGYSTTVTSNEELEAAVKQTIADIEADVLDQDDKIYKEVYSTIEGIIASANGFKKTIEEVGTTGEKRLENIRTGWDDIVDALQQLYDLEKKATDEAERREKIAEKELAVKEAEQALEDAKNARGVKRVGESGRLEIQQDEKKIAEAEDKLLKAQESLAEETKSFNDWLQQQAWAELKEMFKAGTATNAGVLALLSKYLDKQEGGDSDWANQYLGWIKEVSGVELPSFDNGGIAYGLGAMPKATARAEMVLPPDITETLLKPNTGADFTQALRNLGIMYETGRYFAQPTATYNNVGATTTTTNDNRVTINGMSLTTEQSNQVLAMFSAMGLVPNNK